MKRLALALALLLFAEPASADPAEVVALTYRVPNTCPNEEAFAAAVRARTTRASFAPEGSRHFSVRIEKGADGFHGRLSVGGAARELASPRCEDLFDAFVLFVAIAIDPEPEAASSPVVEDTPPPPPPPTPPRPSRQGRAPAPPPPPRVPAWHWSFGSGAVLATGVAAHALASAHPFVDLGSDATGVSPSVRLGLVWSNGGAQDAPDSAAQLTVGLRALALSGCAFRFDWAPWNLRACGAFEGGWLTVRPFGLDRPTAPDRPWLAAGPVARTEVAILPHLGLGAAVGALFPFERERVFVRGNPAGALVSAVGIRLSAVIVVSGF